MHKLIVGLILCLALSLCSDAQKSAQQKETDDRKPAQQKEADDRKSAQQKEVFEFNKSVASHNIKLIFKTKSFNPKEHKIEQIRDEEHDWTLLKIDGKEPFGADSTFVPTNEIESVKLVWDGKDVPVEKDIFADCYRPNFEKELFLLKPSADGESLMTFMAGADGGLGYVVFWIFRKDGRHSRFIQHNNDIDYSNFTQGFFTED